MGKKTPSASASKSEVTDLPVDAAVGDCPLKRKGDIQVAVVWAHNGSVVSGVPIDLQGPTPGSGSTDGTGLVRFKKCVPGAYTYEADFSAIKMKYPARLVATSATSVKRDKLTTVTLTIEELSALKVELIEQEDDKEIGAVPDQDVISIAGGGAKEKGKATAELEKIPAGEITLTVEVKAPDWKLAPGQTLTVKLVSGLKTEKKIFVQRQSLVTLKIHDLDTKKDLTEGNFLVTLPEGTPTIARLKNAKVELRFPKTAKKIKVTEAVTGSGKDTDTLYEFVELTSA